MITSGKGGVGKTTCCANIGRALSERGKKTLLIEGDIGLNNLDAVLRVEDGILYDIGEYAAGKATLRQCLMQVGENLWLLPATAASSVLTAAFFAETVGKLKSEFDFVLIDSPAGLEEGFYRAAHCAQEAIIVTTPHVTGIRDGYKTARVLESYGIKKIGLIVNRVRGEWVLKKETVSPEDAAEVMNVPLIGTVPEDDDLNLFGLVGLRDGKEVTAAVKLIAAYVCGEGKKIYDCTARWRGIKNRIRRWLG